MNFYSIYFTRNGQVVRLPFNPSELPDEQEAENGQYNVLGIGPLSIARDPNQRKVKISSFFPGTVGSSLTSLISFRPPEYYIEFFRSAMRDREPVLYTPTRIDELGIPQASGRTLHMREIWSGEESRPENATMRVRLAPHDCRLWRCRVV